MKDDVAGPLADPANLESVLSREAAQKICDSVGRLFGLSVRVLSREGSVLGECSLTRALCEIVNEALEGQAACASTFDAALTVQPDDGAIVHPCFTGAVYRIAPLDYQGHALGRIILGPYVPAETEAAPESLFTAAHPAPSSQTQAGFDGLPRMRADIAKNVTEHLSVVFERLIFEGHRAQLATDIQAASVRENHRELTEKNELLRAALDELEELGKLKSSFLATVSHELRTPLTSIIGYSEMLEGGAAGLLSDDQAEFLHTIRIKAEQLLELIGSLLDLGRLEAGTMALNKQRVDAGALLSDIASTIVPVVNQASISLAIHVDEATPRLDGDPTRLRQIVLNLADNAVKFTPPGGSVELRAHAGTLDDRPGDDEDALFEKSRPAVVLEVRDTGRGIEPDKRARIFDAFYQIDSGTTREVGGAGLGLSIVKQLVDSHGGTIEVTSEVGAGTVFVVTLPAALDDA